MSVAVEVVDRGMAGDVKMLADVDGDGRLDPMVAGGPREGLMRYRFPGLEGYRIATPRAPSSPSTARPPTSTTATAIPTSSSPTATARATRLAGVIRAPAAIRRSAGNGRGTSSAASAAGQGHRDRRLRRRRAAWTSPSAPRPPSCCSSSRRPASGGKLALLDPRLARCMACSDVDRDGRVDLVLQYVAAQSAARPAPPVPQRLLIGIGARRAQGAGRRPRRRPPAWR
ncbi:MAG: hypothetical protein U1E35_09310 [Rhodospirillales bacterium]